MPRKIFYIEREDQRIEVARLEGSENKKSFPILQGEIKRRGKKIERKNNIEIKIDCKYLGLFQDKAKKISEEEKTKEQEKWVKFKEFLVFNSLEAKEITLDFGFFFIGDSIVADKVIEIVRTLKNISPYLRVKLAIDSKNLPLEVLNNDLNLQELIVSGLGVGVASKLAEALKTNETLTTLHFSRAFIADEDARALAAALKANKTLTTLHLSGNSIGSEGGTIIADALETNKTLTTLDISRNDLGPKDAKIIDDALKTNETLTTLNLSNNSIRPDGATAIAGALKTNTTLTTLDLNYSSIGPGGAKAFADLLKTNKTLTTLNLKFNSIGPEGATAIAEALETNKTLTTLDLNYNSIGDVGATAIAKVLKTNTTLTTLNLGDNSIGPEGEKELAKAVYYRNLLTPNNKLLITDLELPELNEKDKNSIATEVERRRMQNPDPRVSGAYADAPTSAAKRSTDSDCSTIM